TNGLQQQSIFVSSDLIRQGFATAPVWPGLVTPQALPAGTFPAFSGVRVFSRDYANPRIYSFNAAYEQELVPDWSAYADFICAKGVRLTRFLSSNRSGPACCDQGPGTGNVYTYAGSP